MYPNNGSDSISDFDVVVNTIGSGDFYFTPNVAARIDTVGVESGATFGKRAIDDPAIVSFVKAPP
jgi:hypothetical protein